MRGDTTDRKIVKLMRQGACVKEISHGLNMGVSAVKHRISTIYSALGLFGSGAWREFYIMGEREVLRRLMVARKSRIPGGSYEDWCVVHRGSDITVLVRREGRKPIG